MDLEKLKAIAAIVSDVDGVLTDGGIVAGPTEAKVFNVRDGLAVKLWQRAGHSFALLSGGESDAVTARARTLGIDVVKMGRLDKQRAFAEILAALQLTADRVAYVGDDLPDLAPLSLAALGFCPRDAAPEVCAAADVVVPLDGGNGVVRHIVEAVLKAQGKWPSLVAAFEVHHE